MSEVKSRLADLAVLQSRTDADEQKILDAAIGRHDELQKQLPAASLAARSDPDAAAGKYQAMVQEIGQLSIVIGKARAALQ